MLSVIDSLSESNIAHFYEHGWVWLPNFLPSALNQALLADLQQHALHLAGIGRQQDHLLNQTIRRDKTAWITGHGDAQHQYLALMDAIQTQFNQRFFLGLFDFECHYACYEQGDFYLKHLDAFRGKSNRVLTTVTYLNDVTEGGALVLYNENDHVIQQFQPSAGALLIFESERFPHEVLATSTTRYSIAGWFRRNNSLNGRIDPIR